MRENIAQRVLSNVEINLLVFSFLVNFVWEMWQVPFFQNLPSGSHLDGIRICTQASAGDAVITLTAYWCAASVARSRLWLHRISVGPALTYWLAGVLVTIGMEWLATGPLDRWEYANSMPRLPVIGTGVLPLLQWTVLPPLILFLTRRQVRTP